MAQYINGQSDKQDKSKKDHSDTKNYTIASATHEFTQRFGEAGGQFLAGLRGIDNATGQVFDRSLQRISEGRINPATAEQNIKQQAGYSAEVASVSKRNAEAIINQQGRRFARSEDLAAYGKNDPVVDIVELIDDQAAFKSQMKFVTNQKDLLQKIAKGEGDGKRDLSRYMEVDKLEVPTEQVENMKKICREEAKKLSEQAKKLKLDGKLDKAQKLQKQAENYKELEGKISDSGLTTEEAIRYRLNPHWETTKDIANVSHRAGMQGMKLGAAIGGSISLFTNIIALHSGEKEFADAALDVTKDTLISGAVGYSTTFTGTAIKTYMQQSSSAATRSLSQTGLPAMIVSACLATSKSITKYAKGEINEAKLTQEMGLTASGMLSASMFSAIGQVAIPIPVLGAMIGGMVGYTLTNTFYQSFFDVLKEAKLSAERRQIVEMQCRAAKIIAKEYEQRIKTLFAQRIAELDQESKAMFAVLDNPNISADDFCAGMNRFAEILGKKISINNIAELDAAMLSDKPLSI